ncbi:VWA domain-containing protein [Streptomyces sp. NPDC047130]|uniref:VWA domain-containing protein n=1 Tax=Streptomyces sp. NPDC047130 TaxID=3155261 RepID=UPI0034065734
MPAHFMPEPPNAYAPGALSQWEDDGGPAYEPAVGLRDLHWMRIGAEMAARLPEIAGREDLIVTCRPGTQSGAPAAFFTDLAHIEVDGRLFGPVHPATVHLAKPGDEEDHPVVWGALTHEAAHAAHTKWHTPEALRGTAQGHAADILEESRIEKAHLGRRPQDRTWLRSVVTGIIQENVTPEAGDDKWQAATAAGLILARRDAGILTPEETEPLEAAVTTILGPDLLANLAAIWQAAHATGDEDEQSMLAHAKAWCDLLATEPEFPQPFPQQGQSEEPSELAAAIAEVTSTVDVNNAADTAIRARKREKAQQAARAQQAAEAAEKVFHPETAQGKKNQGSGASPVSGTRQPTSAEKSAAGRLARALRAAAFRERTVTVTASAAPPGRLSMRGALARDAQRAAGAVPTALPWIRTERRQGPIPPLRVGIAVDVSASMDNATGPIASAAWIVAKAAALTDPDSRTATVAFSRALTAITAPGKVPSRVTRFDANDFGHNLAEVIDALTAGLGLTTPGAGRLLVIASDGRYGPTDATAAAERITALRAAGCAVLWLAFEPGASPLPGSTFLELTDPAQAVAAIGKAATAALAAT